MSKPAYPCEHMKMYAEFTCEMHPDPWDCADAIIIYNEKLDEYGIPIKDGGRSMARLSFCPWCGVALPDSKRDAWFDELEAMGIDPWGDEIPEAYSTSQWWRQKGDGTADAAATPDTGD